MPVEKGTEVETTPLRRSSRIAAAEPSPARVQPRRRASASSEPSGTPGRVTRSKRLSLSEEGKESTPPKSTKGMLLISCLN